MKWITLFLFALGSSLFAQKDGIKTKTTYAKAYGETKNPVEVDATKDLPRYPAVEPKDAIATWQVKKGFKLQLAAHEPQVRDPIAICFDERGRMFVCEMHDYSEMRDVTPHMGRVSVLEDKDGDGYFETSRIFADDLPWPTALIWANGGLYVGATPDIWRFEDKDDDGKAEVREKVFTGFGTGLKILNVQGLMNSFQWGQDNRIHLLAGGGNRGVVTCLKRPDLKGVELGGKDFWFNPLTHEFGLEGGGAQYGMSFDNYGRKFGCSNSDHLQYWVYDDKYANRNTYYQMPRAKESIAADGGAAEVFRISPDEPWRIIRTRWRIAGVVKGAVEGGGRVSGYFTGATGTTIYRGDAYGPEFVNNSFTGDAGGQLVHRKIIKPSADGISLIGERPADEQGFEFAASKDTWVRTVNFANAPDGCLHICDMYREVIEHPWSIPDEIKKHLDLNSGNDRGRIYRIVPEGWQRAKGEERRGNIAKASTEDLVKLLRHPNGWHRDTAQRLLFERQDKAAVPMLKEMLLKFKGAPYSPEEARRPAFGGTRGVAKLHALSVLSGLSVEDAPLLVSALTDNEPDVRAAAVRWVGRIYEHKSPPDAVASLLIEKHSVDPDLRVRYDTALIADSLGDIVTPGSIRPVGDSILQAVLYSGFPNTRGPVEAIPSSLMNAALGSRPDRVWQLMKTGRKLADLQPDLDGQLLPMVVVAFAGTSKEKARSYLNSIANSPLGTPPSIPTSWRRAILVGLKRAGITPEDIDEGKLLGGVVQEAIETAKASSKDDTDRFEAIKLLGLVSSNEALGALIACLGQKQPEAVQTAAIRVLAQNGSTAVTSALISNWAHYGAKSKTSALEALLSRDDRVIALLESKVVKAEEFSAAQVQALLKHKSAQVVTAAQVALAAVIPPSREKMAAKFKPAIAAKGDSTKGQAQFMARCMACHKAGTQGLAVGPDLITVKTKGREALLESILQPHKEVASQFIAYTVNTRDGQTFAGIITNDTASSMTIKMMGGVEKTLQRADIKGSSSSGQSLMPEGLETGMSVEDMADLLTYIESL